MVVARKEVMKEKDLNEMMMKKKLSKKIDPPKKEMRSYWPPKRRLCMRVSTLLPAPEP